MEQTKTMNNLLPHEVTDIRKVVTDPKKVSPLLPRYDTI